jgi:hypothetical protein
VRPLRPHRDVTAEQGERTLAALQREPRKRREQSERKRASAAAAMAFSSEVETGSRQENASKKAGARL